MRRIINLDYHDNKFSYYYYNDETNDIEKDMYIYHADNPLTPTKIASEILDIDAIQYIDDYISSCKELLLNFTIKDLLSLRNVVVQNFRDKKINTLL